MGNQWADNLTTCRATSLTGFKETVTQKNVKEP